MSPAIQGQDVWPWPNDIEEYTPSVAIPEPQPEDIELVRACFARGSCL